MKGECLRRRKKKAEGEVAQEMSNAQPQVQDYNFQIPNIARQSLQVEPPQFRNVLSHGIYQEAANSRIYIGSS